MERARGRGANKQKMAPERLAEFMHRPGNAVAADDLLALTHDLLHADLLLPLTDQTGPRFRRDLPKGLDTGSGIRGLLAR